MRRLVRPIRAPGVAKPDERTLLTVALRADSFIEKLYVNETGRHVKKGEPLFRVYSPDMVKVQVDYRISANATGNRDERGALQRLQNLQIPEAVLAELKRTREPVISFDWPSPVSGVVMQKKAIEGMMMKAGDEMLRLADLSSIWVIADVPEQDIAQVRVGAKAKVSLPRVPERGVRRARDVHPARTRDGDADGQSPHRGRQSRSSHQARDVCRCGDQRRRRRGRAPQSCPSRR